MSCLQFRGRIYGSLWGKWDDHSLDSISTTEIVEIFIECLFDLRYRNDNPLKRERTYKESSISIVLLPFGSNGRLPLDPNGKSISIVLLRFGSNGRLPLDPNGNSPVWILDSLYVRYLFFGLSFLMVFPDATPIGSGVSKDHQKSIYFQLDEIISNI